MSESNTNVNITATDESLSAAAARASAAMKDFTNSTDSASRASKLFGQSTDEASRASKLFSNDIDSAARAQKLFGEQSDSSSRAQKLFGSTVEDAKTKMGGFSFATAGATRELMVIGHEAMQGRFSRIPGSLMVLAERMGGVTLATGALAAGLAAAALAAYHLVEWLGRVRDMRAGVEAAGAFFNADLDVKELDKLAGKYREMTGVTTEESGKVVSAYASMRGATIPLIQELINQTNSYASATHKSLSSAAEDLKRAMESPTESGERFLNNINASKEAIERFNNISGQNAVVQRRTIMLEELNKATDRVRHTTEGLRKSDEDAPAGGAHLLMNPAEDINYMQQAEDDKLDKRKLSDEKLAAQHKAALAALNNQELQTSGQTPTWFQKQQEGAEELRSKVIGSATTFKAANTASAGALMEYWHKAEDLAEVGSKNQLRAHEEYLRHKEQFDLANLKVSDHNAQAGFEGELAALTAKQKANKDNHDLVMQLEDQKLALLLQHYGQDSKQYQNELGRKSQMEQEYARQSGRIAEDAVKTKERLDADSLASKTKELNAEVAAGTVTKQQALETLKSFVQTNADAELEMQDNVIKNLTAGTEAYAHAMNMRAEIVSKTAKQISIFNSQESLDATRNTNHTAKEFSNMFDSIGSASKSSISSLIDGTSAWQQAEKRVLDSVLSSFADMALKMVARWAVTELAKNAISSTQNAVRVAQEAGGTGFGAILAGWLGLETTKTAITTTGATTRATTDSGSSFLGAIGSMISGWFGMETAKTATTGAQAAARTVVTTAAQATQAIETGVVNAGSAMSYAAVGAAAAGASVAAIPIVGWAAAPEVAAGTFGILAAYAPMAALAVGAYDVPQDMPALIHKGEMVVPTNMADGLRQGGTLGGDGGGGSVSASYSPTFNAGAGGLSKSDMGTMMARSNKDFYQYLHSVSANGSTRLPGRGLS